MARAPVLAAGGIVLRQEETPVIAVVRLRKRNEWVLPKGKLDDGETARDAAMREVLEETGHEVSVHEFLGTLVYESGGRCKVVHYWRMETSGEQAYELMDDVRAVDWLPLDAAVERLSRAMSARFSKMSDRSRWRRRRSPGLRGRPRRRSRRWPKSGGAGRWWRLRRRRQRRYRLRRSPIWCLRQASGSSARRSTTMSSRSKRR